MTVSFPLPLAEHYRAYRAAFHRQPAAWVGYAFFGGFPVLLLLLYRFTDGRGWAEAWAETWHLLALAAAALLVGFPLIHLQNVRALRRGNRSLEAPQSYAFGPDGFRTWGPLFNTSVLWAGVDRAVETRRYFFLYVSAAAAYFVPKAGLSAAEVAGVRAALGAGLGPRAQLAGPARAHAA